MQRSSIGWVLLFGLTLVGCNREDYSTPKKAARTFYLALMKGDTNRAQRGLCDPAQAAVLPDVQTLMTEVLAARDAAIEKFGHDGEDVTGGMPSLDDLDKADQAIDGQNATVIPPLATKLVITLRQIQGQWKVDLLATFHIAGDDTAKARQLIQSTRQAVATETQRIRDGKYANAQDAEAALESSIRQPIAGELLRKFGNLLHSPRSNGT